MTFFVRSQGHEHGAAKGQSYTCIHFGRETLQGEIWMQYVTSDIKFLHCTSSPFTPSWTFYYYGPRWSYIYVIYIIPVPCVSILWLACESMQWHILVIYGSTIWYIYTYLITSYKDTYYQFYINLALHHPLPTDRLRLSRPLSNHIPQETIKRDATGDSKSLMKAR